MRLHRAFRVAGGAGGVADGGKRIGPDGDRLERLTPGNEFAKGRRSAERAVAEDDGVEPADARRERGRDFIRATDQRLCAAVPGHIGDLGRRQHHVDRIDHGAGLQRA